MHQGRALGGSSAINAHVFVPPSKFSIDAWGTLGNREWNWATLQGCYAKTYSVHPTDSGQKEWLGHQWDSAASGPLKTSFPGKKDDPIRKAWSDTFQSLGYHMDDDPFVGSSPGAFSCLASIDGDRKERSYAATAFYLPAKNRQNLHVKTGVLVEKINFDTNTTPLRAAGVRYKVNGHTMTVNARTEVILAAGALQSPKLLELSGIGSVKRLASHCIEVLIDNSNVGENLQDHVVCSVGFQAKDHLETLDDLVRQDQKAIGQAMNEYSSLKSGPLTSVGVGSYAYLPLMEFLSPNGATSLKELLRQSCENTAGSTKLETLYHDIARTTLEDEQDSSGAFLAVATQTILPADPSSGDGPLGPSPGKFITVGTMLSQPLSRGSVHITSADASVAPAIDPRYFSHPLDIEILARHMLYIKTIASTPPFSDLLEQPLRERDPKSRFANLEAAKAYLRSGAISMWHVTSTCSMLPEEEGGVVDEQLVVHGTQNLRIVDASIMPLIPRANVQSTVYAVAQRAAELLKTRYAI